LCLHQLGRVVDAAQHYALAWTLDPSDAGCALRLGECHAALGDREAAAEAFHTAIELCSPPDTNPDIRLAAEAALDQLNA
jgi:Flp pilus assembly protein TadD